MTSPGRQLLLAHVSERQWREQVLVWAGRSGWLAYFTWSSVHSPAGFPDLVLVRPPRLVFAELKAGRGQPTALQRTWLKRLGQCPGVEAYLWKPSDEDSVQHFLR